MSKNPILQKKYEEGKRDGYSLGLEHGELLGIQKTTDFISERFNKLQDMPGIGLKTLEKFKLCFGEEYFEEVKR